MFQPESGKKLNGSFFQKKNKTNFARKLNAKMLSNACRVIEGGIGRGSLEV